MVRCNRRYDGNAGNWLQNALSEHRRSPFHAIVAAENPGGEEVVLLADDLDEMHPLMNVPHDGAVPRDATSLSTAMKEMLRFGSHILFVDPFFDPFNGRYKGTLRECLTIVSTLNPDAVCEIHYRDSDKTPTPDAIRRAASNPASNLFLGVIPRGLKLSIFCWREKSSGADFHARYLLTDKGGIGIDAGFSAEGEHQTTDLHLMTFELSQKKLEAFRRDATDYELVEPAIRVNGDGQVETL